MTIDDVIAAGTLSFSEHIALFSLFEWFASIFCGIVGGLFGAAFSMLPFAFSEGNESESDAGWTPLFVVNWIGLSSLIVCLLLFSASKGQEPEVWRETIAEPYYDTIPKTVKEIDVISISGTDNHQQFEIMFVEKNGDPVITHEVVYASIEKDEAVQSTLYTYKHVEKDIPKFKVQGRYEEVVKVPHDFVFTKKEE